MDDLGIEVHVVTLAAAERASEALAARRVRAAPRRREGADRRDPGAAEPRPPGGAHRGLLRPRARAAGRAGRPHRGRSARALRRLSLRGHGGDGRAPLPEGFHDSAGHRGPARPRRAVSGAVRTTPSARASSPAARAPPSRCRARKSWRAATSRRASPTHAAPATRRAAIRWPRRRRCCARIRTSPAIRRSSSSRAGSQCMRRGYPVAPYEELERARKLARLEALAGDRARRSRRRHVRPTGSRLRARAAARVDGRWRVDLVETWKNLFFGEDGNYWLKNANTPYAFGLAAYGAGELRRRRGLGSRRPVARERDRGAGGEGEAARPRRRALPVPARRGALLQLLPRARRAGATTRRPRGSPAARR